MPGKVRDMLAADPKRVILLDGGMGSALAERGIDVANAMWGSYCFLQPLGTAINHQVHVDYADQGAEILTTNTHNVRLAKCTRFIEDLSSFSRNLLPQVISELPTTEQPAALHSYLLEIATQSAVFAASQCTDRDIAVAGCTGSVEPQGAYASESEISIEQACDRLRFEFTARKQLKHPCDLMIFETLTTRNEIEGIALLAQQMPLDDFAVGLTCGAEAVTVGGVPVDQAVEILRPAKPLIYFIQCTPYQFAAVALEKLMAALSADEVAGVYANDGRVWADGKWTGQPVSPAAYADEADKWKQMGARVIGGCCGTGPQHIRALRTHSH